MGEGIFRDSEPETGLDSRQGGAYTRHMYQEDFLGHMDFETVFATVMRQRGKILLGRSKIPDGKISLGNIG